MLDLQLALLVALVAGTAAAKEDSGVQRSLEMPAQCLMMNVVSRLGAQLADFLTGSFSEGLSDSWQVVADLFPDFARAQGNLPPREDCCVIHDKTYHAAGGARNTSAGHASRLAADRNLRAFVVETCEERIPALAERYRVNPDQIRRAYDILADVRFISVRFGRGPYTDLPWRWGLGWPSCVFSQP